jgi:hypothetical protein
MTHFSEMCITQHRNNIQECWRLYQLSYYYLQNCESLGGSGDDDDCEAEIALYEILDAHGSIYTDYGLLRHVAM